MIAIAWEFLTSKVGRYIMIALSAAATLGLLLLKAFGAGKAAERQKQQEATLDDVEKAHEIHGDVGSLGRKQLSDELRKYTPR